MTDEELAKAVSQAVWKFTPANGNPHEYVMIYNERPLWKELSGRIKKYGYQGYFGKMKFRYYDFLGWKYWHYEEVLNREPLPGNEVWRERRWQEALALKEKKNG